MTSGDPAVPLGQLKTLLAWDDLPCYGTFDRNRNVADILARLPPESERLPDDRADLLAALVVALNDRGRISDLGRFPAWRDQPAIALNRPSAESSW